MKKRIVIFQGHPDPVDHHFGHALAECYANGARQAGHEVKITDVAKLDFPLLRSKEDFDRGEPPETIRDVQQTLDWAEHLVIFYPLWLGAMPALLKGLLEQVFRPTFTSGHETTGPSGKRRLQGKSARIVVTMGMPALIYRWYFGAHGLKNLERNILRFCGFSPVKHNLIGMVEAEGGSRREKWLTKMEELGREAK